MAIAIPTTNVLVNAFVKYTPSALRTLPATSRKRGPGTKDGGVFEISASVFDETINIQ
jgi:hypothetical protein